MPTKKHVCMIGYEILEDGICDFFWEDTPIGEYDMVMPFKYCPDCGKKQKGLNDRIYL